MQTYTPHRGTKWGGVGRVVLLQPLPWFLRCLALSNSLSCDLQDKVNVMDYGAAGGPSRYPKWLPTWPPSCILLKNSNLSAKLGNCKYVLLEL